MRHRRASDRAHLRSVLHDEGRRRGHGPRSLRHAAHPEGAPRARDRAVARRARHDVLDQVPAGRRGAQATRAAPVRGGGAAFMSERPTGDTVLLVEDDETLRQTIAMILEMEGYTILQAQSGSDAISLAMRKSVQLVISDIRLPGGVDGIDLLLKLKGMLRSTPRMILMTGYADQAATVRALRVGVDDYIHKPFEMEVLLH